MAEIVKLKRGVKCHFCGSKSSDVFRYGPTYKLGDIRVHYYCVLLSNKLVQNGSDDEGILGFLLPDIKKELQRSSNTICIYCGTGKATITCSQRKCQKAFHLPCGLRNGSLHQFINQFKSYCQEHRPIQNIPEEILSEALQNGVICCICYDNLNLKDEMDFLWAPCCLKTWYHRFCIQKLAYNAGYFFKCAICNDAKKFKVWMERYGIFIPQQDASWERVPNAFVELMYKYDRCDAENCKCPKGRKKNAENTMWEIVLCDSCGSQGIHIACGNLKFVEPEWECETCLKVSKSLSTSATEVSKSVIAREESPGRPKLAEITRKKKRRCSEDLENSVLDKRKSKDYTRYDVGAAPKRVAHVSVNFPCRPIKAYKLNLPESKTSLAEDEEGEDEVEVDVESLEEKQKGKGNLPETKNENDYSEEAKSEEADMFSEVEFFEVLTSIKPGPLSHKLSFLKRLLEESTSSCHPEEHPRNTSTVIDLIDLTCEDEDDSSDVEVLQPESAPEPVACPDHSTHTKAVNQDLVIVPQMCSPHVEIICEREVSNEKTNGGGDVIRVGTEMHSLISSPQLVTDSVICLGNWKPVVIDSTLEILIED